MNSEGSALSKVSSERGMRILNGRRPIVDSQRAVIWASLRCKLGFCDAGFPACPTKAIADSSIKISSEITLSRTLHLTACCSYSEDSKCYSKHFASGVAAGLHGVARQFEVCL